MFQTKKGSGSGYTRRTIKKSGQNMLGGRSDTNDASTPKPSLRQGRQQYPPIPPGLSFNFTIDAVVPNYDYQHRLTYPPLGLWQPPTYWNAVTRYPGSYYRWQEGRVYSVPIPRPSTPFRVATVFSQEPATPQLLAVEFDVTTRNVSEDLNGGWRRLTFRPSNDYSYVDGHSEGERLPFPGSPTWIPQLVPSCYNCEDTSLPAAGLVGKLPLLLSLTAFSCPSTWLDYVLKECIRPHEWVPHHSETGRTSERGMIVSVFLDPTSNFTEREQRQHLKNLENGDYGPVFGV